MTPQELAKIAREFRISQMEQQVEAALKLCEEEAHRGNTVVYILFKELNEFAREVLEAQGFELHKGSEFWHIKFDQKY